MSQRPPPDVQRRRANEADSETDSSGDETDDSIEPVTGEQTSPTPGQEPPSTPDEPTDGRDTTDPTNGEQTSPTPGQEPPSTPDEPTDGSDTDGPTTGEQTSPTPGQEPPSTPDEPTEGRNTIDPTTDERTSPTPGQEPPTESPDEPLPTTDPSLRGTERAQDLRQEAASQTDAFDADSFVVQRTDDGIRAFVPEATQRDVLRERAAQQSDVFRESDFRISETDEGFEVSVPDTLQRQRTREQAASQTDDFFASDFTVRETEQGFEAFISDERRRQEIAEDATEGTDLSPSDVTVEDATLDQSPVAGQEAPTDQVTVTIDESAQPTQTDRSAQEIWTPESSGELTQEQRDDLPSAEDAEALAGATQRTDPTFTDEEYQTLASTLIDSDTATDVTSRGSLISGGIVEGLQESGQYVGGAFESGAQDVADVATAPIEGTRAGSAAEGAIVGALGTAPAAIAQTPGDVALLTRRGEQATRQVVADPTSAGDVATTAAGFGAAGAVSTGRAVAQSPFREGAALGALLVGTGGAAQGARSIRGRVSDARQRRAQGTEITFESPDRRGSGQRTIQRERDSPESRRQQAEQTEVDADSLVLADRDIVQQADFDPLARTRARTRTRTRGRVTQTATIGLVAGEIDRTQQAQTPDVAQTPTTDVAQQPTTVPGQTQTPVVGVEPVTGQVVDTGLGLDVTPTTDVTSAEIVETTATTQQTGRTRRTPRLPSIPDVEPMSAPDDRDRDNGDPFADIDVGTYIDPL